jgi:hypothetical protein
MASDVIFHKVFTCLLHTRLWSPPILLYIGYRESKLPERQADLSPSFGAEVNTWSCTPLPPCVFMACDNFAFTLLLYYCTLNLLLVAGYSGVSCTFCRVIPILPLHFSLRLYFVFCLITCLLMLGHNARRLYSSALHNTLLVSVNCTLLHVVEMCAHHLIGKAQRNVVTVLEIRVFSEGEFSQIILALRKSKHCQFNRIMTTTALQVLC